VSVVAVVQARMTSTRLPGKVLLDIAGRPMLHRVVQRVRRAITVDRVVVATSTDPSDDPIAGWCNDSAVGCRRGSLHDVLSRYYEAAAAEAAEVVVRVTSDCPLIDPGVVDEVISALLVRPDIHYASNTLSPRTFPRGLDVEAVRFAALEDAWRTDDNSRGWREHVTPWLYHHPERYGLLQVQAEADYSGHRWTVDTPDDLELVRRIYSNSGSFCSWREVLALISRHPDWSSLNAHVVQKVVAT
jgi:spore coat polysaccharide biosynthesis protein SpsF